MGPSLQIMRVLDIPIKLHWTFVLMLPLGFYLMDKPGLGMGGTLFFGLLFLLISICVILHEYGHALAARYYGIKTDDIILSPLFGVARIQRLPDTPKGEFWVALAGPLVNIAIGLLLLVYLLIASPESISLLWRELYGTFTESHHVPINPSNAHFSLAHLTVSVLMFVNLGLVVFNLIPAFPMDGGRMFRAILHRSIRDKVRATWIATKVGQVFSAGLMAVSIFYGQYGIAFIGLFIYYMAVKEYGIVENEVFRGRFRIGEVTRSQFTRIDSFSTRSEIAHLFLRSLEKNFLVFNPDGQLQGILPRRHIVHWMKQDDSALRNNLHEHIITEYPNLHPDMKIDDALRTMREHQLDFLPVIEDDELVGVVDRNSIYDYVDTFRKLEGKRIPS